MSYVVTVPEMHFPGLRRANKDIVHQCQISHVLYIVMYKTIYVINIIIHMCLQHSNTL